MTRQCTDGRDARLEPACVQTAAVRQLTNRAASTAFFPAFAIHAGTQRYRECLLSLTFLGWQHWEGSEGVLCFHTAPWMSHLAASFMGNTKTLHHLRIAYLAEPALVTPCR
jgi:hypothetical protein